MVLFDISVLLYQATNSPVAPLRPYYALSARNILDMIKTMTKNTKHIREDCERINRDIVVCNYPPHHPSYPIPIPIPLLSDFLNPLLSQSLFFSLPLFSSHPSEDDSLYICDI